MCPPEHDHAAHVTHASHGLQDVVSASNFPDGAPGTLGQAGEGHEDGSARPVPEAIVLRKLAPAQQSCYDMWQGTDGHTLTVTQIAETRNIKVNLAGL